MDLLQRQLVVCRDVEMCAGVVAQTYLLRRVLSFFVANTWLLQKLLRRVLNFFAQTCFCQDLAVAQTWGGGPGARWCKWVHEVVLVVQGGQGPPSLSLSPMFSPIQNFFLASYTRSSITTP